MAAAQGFSSFESAEEVVAGEETEVTYRLAEATDEIEVTVTGERPPREVTRHTIERREMERIPGTSGDALRSIENLPGVATPSGSSWVTHHSRFSPRRYPESLSMDQILQLSITLAD